MAHSLKSGAASTAPIRGPNQPDLDTEVVWQARARPRRLLPDGGALGLEEGICNHFSALVPGYDDLFLVNPYGWAFRELTASRLLICDFHGNVVAGEGEPEATAFYIHARIHKNVPARPGGLPHPHALRDRADDDRGRSADLRRADGAEILRPHGRRPRL